MNATNKRAEDYAKNVEIAELKQGEAHRYAVAHQGYQGSYADWQAMSKTERAEYELSAAGIPTA